LITFFFIVEREEEKRQQKHTHHHHYHHFQCFSVGSLSIATPQPTLKKHQRFYCLIFVLQTSNIAVMFPVNVKMYEKKGLISIVFYYSDGFFLTRVRASETSKKIVIRLLSKLVKIVDDFYV
jgi:hypothetical protein